MQKAILVTGSTDGIGLETARTLVSLGHSVLLHGRNPSKLKQVEDQLAALSGGGRIESYVADLSIMAEVEALADAVAETHTRLDVLINNAGVFRVPDTVTRDGLDVRFAVNTIAAYAQSKLALTMWSRSLAFSIGDQGPAVIAVNPGSMLGSKMVKEAYGVAGSDLRIGAEILCRAALADEFADASGQYFDNDSGRFASPHPDALDAAKSQGIVRVIDTVSNRSR